MAYDRALAAARRAVAAARRAVGPGAEPVGTNEFAPAAEDGPIASAPALEPDTSPATAVTEAEPGEAMPLPEPVTSPAAAAAAPAVSTNEPATRAPADDDQLVPGNDQPTPEEQPEPEL
jgi:hypothetical protein